MRSVRLVLLVTAALLASVLATTPADAATNVVVDGIRVSQDNAGDVTIEGTNNADSPIGVTNGPGGTLSITVGVGDLAQDVVLTDVRNLTISLRAGADSLTVDDVGLPGNLTISAGGGGDLVVIDSATVAGTTNVQMGSAAGADIDTTYLIDSSFAANLTVGGGSGFQAIIGRDGVAVDGALNILTDGGGSLVQIDDVVVSDLNVSGGGDADRIAFTNGDLGTDPTILTRGGDDSVVIDGAGYTGTARIDTDTGTDFVDFFPGPDPGRLDLRTGNGDDLIEAAADWAANSLINGGPGTDSFEGDASAGEGARLTNLETEIPAGTSRPEMVVTANPLATDAAADVLRRGGSAVDAMIAAQTMLGLVEPQSSGVGGGAFVVYYDAATGTTTTYDAREKAPAAATEDRFVGLGFLTRWQSGLSVGVPGVPRLMEQLHDQHGRLPRSENFGPAMAQAISGFEITERTSSQVGRWLSFNPSCEERLFFRDPTAFEYFANPDCSPKPAGTVVENRPYAETMLTLATDGDAGFYGGEIAQNIAAAVQGDRNIPGDMTTDDLANYTVVEREPVCVNYRGHQVCGMGPPSSGGLTVGQILGILESFDLGDDPLNEETVHLVTQAGKLAFADRNLYIGDSDFITVPVDGLIDPDYLAGRAALIGDMDLGTATPGTPPGLFDPSAASTEDTEGGTSHLSIVDQYGNALSMTTSIESSLGNGVMVNGFLLNNQLTDFSQNPTDEEGTPIANRVQPNKRPRSSMSPTIVFDGDGAVKLVTGSPGGSRIIGYTAQSVMNVLDFGLTPAQAVTVPHYLNRNGSTDIEEPTPGVDAYDADALKAALEARGQTVNIRALTSGLSMIEITDDGLLGGADPRRDGTVGGRFS